jgi:hypothetical protein
MILGSLEYSISFAVAMEVAYLRQFSLLRIQSVLAPIVVSISAVPLEVGPNLTRNLALDVLPLAIANHLPPESESMASRWTPVSPQFAALPVRDRFISTVMMKS